MNTFVAIFVICGLFVIGEILSKLTKYKITPYVFAMAFFIILGGQFGLVTEETFNNSTFVTIMYGFAVFFAIACFGASIPWRSLKGEVKTIIISLVSVGIIVGLSAIAGFTFIDKTTALFGGVEVAGGTQAGLIFLESLKDGHNPSASAVVAILITGQVLVGYPACIYATRVAMKKRIANGTIPMELAHTFSEDIIKEDNKKLIKIPDFLYGNFYYVFTVLALVCIAGAYVGDLTGVSAIIWDFFFGFIAGQIGLIDGDSLKRIGADGFINSILFIVILLDLVSLNFKDFLNILPSIILLLALGVIGCAITGLILSKALKMPFWDIVGIALACMNGYPLTQMIPLESVTVLSKEYDLSEGEKNALLAYYSPKIVISGVVSCSIVTGVLAGFFTSIL